MPPSPKKHHTRKPPVIDFEDLQPQPSHGTHLTSEQVATIESYMAKLLAHLDLAHWRVHVAADLPPDDCKLMIQPTDGRRIAMLYVAETWWDNTPADEKREDLVHEALHLAHHDTDEHIRRFIRDSGDISDYTKHLVVSQFKTNLERMVDSLSYVIAPHMPTWDPQLQAQ